MENKGVAPVLATVLIVLVVIALAGTFLVWSTRTLGTTTERGTEQSQKFTDAAQEGIQILSVQCGGTSIVVRNSGSTTYAAGSTTLFRNDVLESVTWTAFDSNGRSTGTVTTAFASGQTIRVVTPQGAQDSDRCA